MTMPAFGDKIGGRCAKTAKRIAIKEGLPLYRIGGTVMVKEVDVTAWLENQRIEPVQSEPDLRSRLQEIRDRVAAKRRAAS